MVMRRILLDEGLLLELLFGRPLPMGQSDRLWDLILQGQIKAYVTDLALGQVGRYTLHMTGSAAQKTTLTQLCNLFARCPLDPAVVKTAQALPLGWPFALQAAIATHLGLDGIVTHRPLDYVTDTGVEEVPVYTPGHLLAAYATGDLDHSRRQLETQYQDNAATHQRAWLGHLEHVQVCCGQAQPTATVRLQTPLGYTCQETASGVGPVDAALRALNLAVNRYIPVADVRMVYYRCLATTADSPVSAMVLLERQRMPFPGRGFHQDVIMASIEAYLDALGYLIFCDRL